MAGSVLLANLKNQTFGTNFNVYTHLVNSGFGDIAAGKENYYYVTNYSWMKATFNTLFGTEATLAMKQAYAAMSNVTRSTSLSASAIWRVCYTHRRIATYRRKK